MQAVHAGDRWLGMAGSFVPLGAQLEEEEAKESQPVRDKVSVSCCREANVCSLELGPG